MAEKNSALTIPQSVYRRFTDYALGSARVNEQKEKEAAELAALRKASYELTKTWNDSIQNVKQRRKEELLSRRRKAEEERKQFVQDMAEKRAAERAKTVEQAKMLLLREKPLCRKINRALLVSECLRELDAQIELRKIFQDLEKKKEAELADMIKADYSKYEMERKEEEERRLKKQRDYGAELRACIEANAKENEIRERNEREREKRDRECAMRDLQIAKEREMEQVLLKKNQLLETFKNAIEEKEQLALRLKREEEFEDRAIMVYQETKARIKKLSKPSTVVFNEEIVEVEKKHTIGEEKQENAPKPTEKINLCGRHQIQNTNHKVQSNDLKVWDTLQRFRKTEYEEVCDREKQKRNLNVKLPQANDLRKHIDQNVLEKEEATKALQDETMNTRAILKNTNQKILAYGEQVLMESKDIRPSYPIVKAHMENKKEISETGPVFEE